MAYHHTIANTFRHKRKVVPEESMAVGRLMSRELLKFSTDDRTAIHEEIHGVRCLAATETPELIVTALNEFQTVLDRLLPSQKQTYEECRVRAMLYQDEERSCYALHDENFRLRFLRAEVFNVAKAAVRFANYLDFVKTYWGTDIVLKRLIRFSDFSKDEMKLFRKGYFQVLPFRDRSGRRVITMLGGCGPDVDPQSRAKVLFYLVDALSRTDVESQRKGFVVVSEAYCFCASTSGNEKRSSLFLNFPHPQEGFNHLNKVMRSIPFRMTAMHHCWPDRPAFRLLTKLVTIYGMATSDQKLRLKFHIGDELEMRYRLKSFGIPIELLPITETGTIKMVNHNYWMKTRKQIEHGFDTDVTIVECPGTNDVVFRQGTSSMENPGNAQCRDLILTLLEQNETFGPGASPVSSSDLASTSNNIAKHQNVVVDRLLDIVVNYYGGRILEWDKHRNTWIQMRDGAKIKQKASVLLYSIARRYRNPRTGGRSPETTASNEHVQQLEHHSDEGSYNFVEGGKTAIEKQPCCHHPTGISPKNDRKRQRRE
mmetsp:Transcript_7448/g.18655  ORF Transcript_7448/g.18655 Transcript_7448/m.18655 type:complete len:540 (-) Transcript_7448:1637-3256(-)